MNKFPLDSILLRRLSATDPKAIGHSSAASILKKLPRHFPTVLKENEVDEYTKEVNRLQLDNNLPAIEDPNGKEVRLDSWWAEVFDTERYPHVEKIMKAVLSIFTAPHVEQSFSVMNNIITSKTNRMDVTTYSAIQRVKYNLKIAKTDTVTNYKRPDKVYSSVDSKQCYHMQTAYARHKKDKDAKKAKEIYRSSSHKLPSVHKLADKTKRVMCHKRKARPAVNAPSQKKPRL